MLLQRNRPTVDLPPAENMTQLPDQSLFQDHFADLGKTNLRDPLEAKLLYHYSTSQPPRMPNHIFLYEVSQIFDKTEGRNVQFSTDLQNFLGLDAPLFINVGGSRKSPNYHFVIDICEDKCKDLRKRLLENGRKAARWIREYFLKSDDVTVSNPEYFPKLLDRWTIDPCIKRAKDSGKAPGKIR